MKASVPAQSLIPISAKDLYGVIPAFGSLGVYERSDFLDLTQVNIAMKPSLYRGYFDLT